MSGNRFTQVERRGDAFCARLARSRLNETEIAGLIEELEGLITEQGCRRLVVSLGPQPPEFLYSVFLAKLVHLQRVLREHGGEMALCEAGPEVRSIFAACRLDTLFTFVNDFDAAVARWAP
jgi:anti-anti-sigma factor